MILITRVFTRPSKDIPWPREVLPIQEINNKLYFKYTVPGKHLNNMVEISQDELTMTIKAYWESRECFDEYDNDEEFAPYWTIRDTYCNSTGITLGSKEITQI